jgi:hypothetical protein
MRECETPLAGLLGKEYWVNCFAMGACFSIFEVCEVGMLLHVAYVGGRGFVALSLYLKLLITFSTPLLLHFWAKIMTAQPASERCYQ